MFLKKYEFFLTYLLLLNWPVICQYFESKTIDFLYSNVDLANY